ncbi:MAG: GNAT family N-acetyltransferase [Patescibacteria group bacterium]|nr:GNAT family N-acetyltransferase [Patescibacteria group bacterium]
MRENFGAISSGREMFFARKAEHDSVKETERIKEIVLDYCSDTGILREEKGRRIWDIAAFKDIDFRHAGAKEEVPVNKHDFFRALCTESGVSLADYQSAEKNEKLKDRPIFYYPSSIDDAMSPKKIAANESYIGYWDLGTVVKDWSVPVELPSGENVGLNELFITKMIFGKLHGRRDEKGNLIVDDPETSEPVKFTAKIFDRNFGGVGKRGEGGNTSFSTPIGYLQKNAPHIMESGLLLSSDFRSLSEKSGNIYRHRYSVAANGIAYIGGAKYSLGADFDSRRQPEKRGAYFVVELGKGLAGIIEKSRGGYESVTHVFKLKNEEEIEKIRANSGEKKKRGDVVFKKNDIEILPYGKADSNRRFSGESGKEYSKRMRLLENCESTEKIVNDISLNTGISAHRDLSWHEQEWLAASAGNIEGMSGEIIAQAKKFGIDFLRSFLSCEFGMDSGRAIIDIAKKIPPEVSKKLFYKYGEFVNAAEEAAEDLENQYGVALTEVQKNRIMEKMLRRGRDLLLNYASRAEAGTHGQTAQAEALQMLNDLERVRSDMVLFSAVFKEANIPLEQMKDTEVSSVNARYMNRPDKKRMMELAEMNYGKSRVGQEIVKPSLAKAMEDRTNTFYLLKKDDEVIGGFRIQDAKDKYYFGSFNMDPNAKASGLGNAMLEKVIADLSRKKPVEAVAEAEKPVISYYVNKLGFRIAEFLPDMAGTGVDGFKIVKDGQKIEEIESKKYTDKNKFIRDVQKNIANGGIIVGYRYDEKAKVYEVSYGRVKEPVQKRMAA